MDSGRIQALVVATTSGSVVYERFYARLSDLEKADLRSAFYKASEPALATAQDEAEFAARYKAGALVFKLEADLLFYLLGTGEYDELNLAEALRALVGALRDTLKRQPTEALLFDNYGKLCLVVDELINEGILEATDKEAIQRGIKMKQFGEP
ncbi:hypothetical protein WJX72_005088 [[Myrmecia] bisecta]|uniref:Coatomer subunit zeta n=1 Tax=[Myrmecia] bisecta TaxID=41462 RepID=A0AAW1PNQ1_9CHLO